MNKSKIYRYSLIEYMKILSYFMLKTCRIHFQGVFITYDDEKIYTYLYCRESTKGTISLSLSLSLSLSQMMLSWFCHSDILDMD